MVKGVQRARKLTVCVTDNQTRTLLPDRALFAVIQQLRYTLRFCRALHRELARHRTRSDPDRDTGPIEAGSARGCV
jgi:hypothetical protein